MCFTSSRSKMSMISLLISLDGGETSPLTRANSLLFLASQSFREPLVSCSSIEKYFINFKLLSPKKKSKKMKTSTYSATAKTKMKPPSRRESRQSELPHTMQRRPLRKIRKAKLLPSRILFSTSSLGLTRPT